MDTTKQNIKMCRKAEEIQKLWKPAEGDFVFGAETDGVWPINDWHLEEVNLSLFIWLPRQDQLQEILRDKWFPREMLIIFNAFVFPQLNGKLPPVDRDKQSKYVNRFTSMEQLWLVFVMSECFGKIWSGIDWIKK